jgi:hypothetical protein
MTIFLLDKVSSCVTYKTEWSLWISSWIATVVQGSYSRTILKKLVISKGIGKACYIYPRKTWLPLHCGPLWPHIFEFWIRYQALWRQSCRDLGSLCKEWSKMFYLKKLYAFLDVRVYKKFALCWSTIPLRYVGKKRYSSTYLKTAQGISGHFHIPSTSSPGRVLSSCRIINVGPSAGVAMMN